MVLQFILNGLVLGSIIALGAIGLSLIYGIRRFANFAHGDLLTFGAYLGLIVVLFSEMNLYDRDKGLGDLLFMLAIAMPVVALIGIILEVSIFKRLAGRGPIAPLIASVGVALVLQNTVSSIWGTRNISYGLQLEDNWTFAGLSINPIRGLLPIAIGLVLVLLVHILLKYTKLGKAMRATSDNFDLARVSGINTNLVIITTWGIAGALAAAAGVLLAVKTLLTPTIGFSQLLLIFSAVILGGIGSAYGAMLGAYVIGISAELWPWASITFGFDNRFQLAVPFAIMVIMLLVRPTGLLGERTGFDLALMKRTLRGLWPGKGTMPGQEEP
jgi:branched-chain amino acid transport system permease protein/neutral amino acid transport system permease protein